MTLSLVPTPTPLFPALFPCRYTKEDLSHLDCLVTSISSHRNGVSGEGFYVVSFVADGEPLSAVCFFDQDDAGRFTNYDSPHVAVLRLSDTSEGYRGDYFADQLCEAVQAWYDARYGL